MGTKKTICPKCGREYTGKPAISRADNATILCPDCGTEEALSSLGISDDEKAEIISTINKCKKEHGYD